MPSLQLTGTRLPFRMVFSASHGKCIHDNCRGHRRQIPGTFSDIGLCHPEPQLTKPLLGMQCMAAQPPAPPPPPPLIPLPSQHNSTAERSNGVLPTQRLCGRPTMFLTGTDEHGEKIALAAEKQSMSPQEHCDLIASTYKCAAECIDEPSRALPRLSRQLPSLRPSSW